MKGPLASPVKLFRVGARYLLKRAPWQCSVASRGARAESPGVRSHAAPGPLSPPRSARPARTGPPGLPARLEGRRNFRGCYVATAGSRQCSREGRGRSPGPRPPRASSPPTLGSRAGSPRGGAARRARESATGRFPASADRRAGPGRAGPGVGPGVGSPWPAPSLAQRLRMRARGGCGREQAAGRGAGRVADGGSRSGSERLGAGRAGAAATATPAEGAAETATGSRARGAVGAVTAGVSGSRPALHAPLPCGPPAPEVGHAPRAAPLAAPHGPSRRAPARDPPAPRGPRRRRGRGAGRGDPPDAPAASTL